MQQNESEQPSFSYRADPAWLTTDDKQMVEARKGLVGDYNMWVQLSGGTRDLARQLLIKDYPQGPIEGGSDENLRAHLAGRFPWLWAYIAFQYRAGIFNTITFLVMIAILVYIALVYVPRDQRKKTSAAQGAPVAVVLPLAGHR